MPADLYWRMVHHANCSPRRRRACRSERVASTFSRSLVLLASRDHRHRFEQSSSMKNRKRESCTSGTVRDEDGNILIYSANDRQDRGNVGIIRSPNRSSILPDRTGHSTKIIHSAGC
jgi:hypothetical protein